MAAQVVGAEVARRMGTLRDLARAEQRKLGELRATGAPEAAVGDAERRVAALTRRIAALSTEQPPAEARRRTVGGEEEHLNDAERRAKRRGKNNLAEEEEEEELIPCAVCSVPTTRQVRTRRTTSWLCGAACERLGWRAHMDRVRREEIFERKRQGAVTREKAEDAGWAAETAERLKSGGPDVDYLGVPRGACAATGCAGYVQQRGLPRDVAARERADGSVEACGTWSWNRVDHLTCRRCGAPSSDHDNLTDDLDRQRRTAKATTPLRQGRQKKYTERRTSPSSSSHKLEGGGLNSAYYYATAAPAAVQHVVSAPKKIQVADSASSEDEAVAILGGAAAPSRHQTDLRGDKGDASYFYAHDPSKVTHRVAPRPEKIPTTTTVPAKDLALLTVKELLALCKARGIPTASLRASGCIEKADLINLVASH